MSFSSSHLKIKDRRFLKAFDLAATKTLSELGEDVRAAVLYHVAKIQCVSPSDTLKDPLKFAAALEQIFSSGSTILEDKMIDYMCKDLGIPSLNIGGSFDQKIAAVYISAYAKKNNGLMAQISETDKSSTSSTSPLEQITYQ